MASTIHLDHCPVCGSSSQIRELFRALDHTVTRESFAIWNCSNCTTRFTQDIPSPETISRYYKSKRYISHSDTRSGWINKLYHGVRRFTLSAKHRWVQEATGKSSGAILDLGSGTGAFLKLMKKQGWQVTGLEPDPGARKVAKDQHGLTLLDAALLDQLPGRSFHAITLWHVLEHIHDLHGTLKSLLRLLKPGGRILIALPNYTSIDALHYGPSWAAYDVPRHLYHFSPPAMQYLAGIHGMELMKTKPMPFDAFYVSMLSERYLHHGAPLIRGAFIGLKSWGNALFNPQQCSSLVFIFREGAELDQPTRKQ